MATILLVDDHDANRGFPAALFRRKGYHVIQASSAAEARGLIRAERPDLVLVGVLTAAVHGLPFEFGREAGVRADAPCPRFVFSAPKQLMAEARRLALACGVEHLVAQPLEPGEALDVVSGALGELPGGSPGIEKLDKSLIERHLAAFVGTLSQRAADLDQRARQLDQRLGEASLQLETARAALEQEVAKRLWAEDELTHANRRLHEQAMRDALTGLYNRRYLMETFERELYRGRRSGERLGIMIIDIDHFKRYNDSYGHVAGDAVLCAAAKLMQSMVRGEDILCRYGGEEFVLVQAKASADAVMQRAERFRQGIRECEILDDGRRLESVTLSIGMSMFPDHGADAETLLRAADAALYRAKETGRNRVVMIDGAGEGAQEGRENPPG